MWDAARGSAVVAVPVRPLPCIGRVVPVRPVPGAGRAVPVRPRRRAVSVRAMPRVVRVVARRRMAVVVALSVVPARSRDVAGPGRIRLAGLSRRDVVRVPGRRSVVRRRARMRWMRGRADRPVALVAVREAGRDLLRLQVPERAPVRRLRLGGCA